MDNKRILIVDDHPIVAAGLAMLFAKHFSDYSILKAATGEQALDTVKHNSIGVVTVDVSLPDINGTELVPLIKKADGKVGVVVYTEHDEPWIIAELLKGGCNAIVLKDEDPRELIIAVESVGIGIPYFSSRFKALAANAEKSFTSREVEILQLISKGFTGQEIADKLCVSANTVEYHRKKLIKRFGANNNAHMVALALNKGIIRP